MEQEFETEKKQQQGQGKTALVILLLLLLVGSGAANYWLWNKEKTASALAVSKVDSIRNYANLKDSLYAQIAEEQAKVESLRAEIAMYQSGNDSLMRLVDEKEAKIKSLRAMVGSGGSPGKLRALKDSLSRIAGENLEFKNKVQALLSENENYKAMLAEREGQISNLEDQKKTLTDKVTIAAQPTVGPITVTPMSEKKGAFVPQFKAKKVKKLQITFDILGNKLTDKTIEKEYIVRIKNPEGIILSTDTKTLRDSDDVYTVKESVSFDGKQQKIKINFSQEASYKKGKYSVELKEGDEVLDTFTFELM